mmetsp:Transcript_45066/g.111940  ORF Transcript_45066/g.111940 Transcript_45066/m.111940 type:complete len:97 (-) Transcript_45066:6-296(-)
MDFTDAHHSKIHIACDDGPIGFHIVVRNHIAICHTPIRVFSNDFVTAVPILRVAGGASVRDGSEGEAAARRKERRREADDMVRDFEMEEGSRRYQR